MVDLKFTRRAAHFVPLALLRHIAGSADGEPPMGCAYIGKAGVQAVKGNLILLILSYRTHTRHIYTGMALVNRGRLSVQRVEQAAYDTIEEMTGKGGWEDGDFGGKKSARQKGKRAAGKEKSEAEEEEVPVRKRKRQEVDGDEGDGAPAERRRSARRKV